MPFPSSQLGCGIFTDPLNRKTSPNTILPFSPRRLFNLLAKKHRFEFTKLSDADIVC